MSIHDLCSHRLPFALKIAGIHFLISVVIALITAVLVFKIWYPYPYDLIIGGLSLYLIVVAVDVVCGPFLTLILSNPDKSRREMTLDLSLVALVQLAALIYGLHAVAITRPVTVAFETDRFTIASASQVIQDKLSEAPENLQKLPLLGLRRVALRKDLPPDYVLEDVRLTGLGIPPAARPDLWQEDNAEDRQAIARAMHPIKKLINKYPQKVDLIQNAVARSNLTTDEVFYLPLTADKSLEWTVLLNQQGDFVGYLPLDAF